MSKQKKYINDIFLYTVRGSVLFPFKEIAGIPDIKIWIGLQKNHTHPGLKFSKRELSGGRSGNTKQSSAFARLRFIEFFRI